MNGALLATARRAVGHWSFSGAVSEVGIAGADAPLTLTPVRPGMSGAAVFDCRTADNRRYALKAWPAGTDPGRIGEVHRVVRSVRQQGCWFVPALATAAGGSTCIAEAGRCWELAQWMPGEPLTAGAAPAEIAAGAAAIARFHAAAAELGVTVQEPPAVAARLRRLQQLGPLVPKAVASAHTGATASELNGPLGRAARLLAAHWPAAAQQIAARLTPWAHRPIATHYVLRDIHRDHLFVIGSRLGGGVAPDGVSSSSDGGVAPDGVSASSDGVSASSDGGSASSDGGSAFPDGVSPFPDGVSAFPDGVSSCSVSGLIDFDALRVDTPACDLARWVGGFLAGRRDIEAEEVWRAAVAGFEQVRPFAIQHQRLARELLVATTWISLANWMVWLCVEQRRFPAGAGAVAERLEHLCELATA